LTYWSNTPAPINCFVVLEQMKLFGEKRNHLAIRAVVDDHPPLLRVEILVAVVVQAVDQEVISSTGCAGVSLLDMKTARSSRPLDHSSGVVLGCTRKLDCNDITRTFVPSIMCKTNQQDTRSTPE